MIITTLTKTNKKPAPPPAEAMTGRGSRDRHEHHCDH